MPRPGPRGRSKSSDDGARWMGTYGDMVTLLMAFFVMLYAISQVDDAKFIALLRGLDVFGNTTNVEGILDSGPSLLEEGSQAKRPDLGDQVADLPLKPATDPAAAKPSEQREQAKGSGQVDLSRRAAEVREQLDQALARRGLPAAVTDVRPDRRGVVISVSSDDVLFALGSTKIAPKGRRIVAAVAAVVNRYDEDVLVEGHTDDLPISRADYSNWNLSTDRAVAVVELLYEAHDVSPRRLGASGFGEQRPLRPNTGAANRSRNRRVDILLLLTEGDR